MRREPNAITTSKLLTMIRNAQTFEEATTYHETAEEPTFDHYLYSLMDARRFTPKDMIARTMIERSYFYHILNGAKSPGRNIVLRIGFGLGVNLSEMNQLLRLAGLSGLYAKIRRDALLIYAVQQRYTMKQANQLLTEAGETPMYRDD